jgi:hypothetical protein
MKYLLFCLVAAFQPAILAKAAAQVAPAAQKAPIHFASAIGWDSGGAYADSVVVADLNGDGNMDLVVTNDCQTTYEGECDAFGQVSVLIGNGDGTFQPAVTYSTGAYYAYSVAVADLRGNGIFDLVVANWCQSVGAGFECDDGNPEGEVSVLLGNGDGTFQPAVTYSSGGYYAFSVATADLRGRGMLDIVVANDDCSCDDSVGAVGVLLGNGDGTFQSAVSYNSGGSFTDSIATGDVNGDGIPDLLVANWCQFSGDCGEGGSAGVLLGNGDGTFQSAVTYDSNAAFTYSVAVADLMGNGILDLVVASLGENGGPSRNAVGVFLGNGDGTFQPVVSYLAAGAGIDAVAVGDVNGDGIPDLAVVDECQNLRREACIGAGEVSVLLGNGDGTFQSPIKYGSGGYEGSAIAIADINGDGRPDLLATNAEASEGNYNDGSVAVLLNETSYTTKTALTSSPNPAQVNQTVMFTATISPAPPNGEVVTFYEGKTELGTGATADGVATLSTSFAKAKSYTIKASYPGDGFRKASSGTVKQVVNP